MRIVHLPSSFIPDTLGGTEVYVRSLCHELNELGVETKVVWHSNRSEATGPNSHRLPAHVQTRRASLYTRSNSSEPPGFRALLRDFTPDAVHFHAYTLGAGNDHASVCDQEGVPYVITYHTPAMSCPRGTLLRWGREVCDGKLDAIRCGECVLEGRGTPRSLARLGARLPLSHRWLPDSPLTQRLALPSLLRDAEVTWRAFFTGAARIVACADFCRDVLLTNGIDPNRIEVRRQGLAGPDRERTLRSPRLNTSAEKPLRLGYFGRISPEKGPELLPAAVRVLRSRGILAEGTWVGPVDDTAWTRELFAQGAPEVKYLGTKVKTELTDWISTQDVIVIPSLWLETGPQTLLEAWDMGTPVVGTDRGGIRDFMTAAGLSDCLFPANDPAGIADAIERLCDPNRTYSTVMVPGMRSLAERMIDIYQAIRRQRHASSVGSPCKLSMKLEEG